MLLVRVRETGGGCGTCRRPFEAGETVGYAGRGLSFCRAGECAPATAARPTRRGAVVAAGLALPLAA